MELNKEQDFSILGTLLNDKCKTLTKKNGNIILEMFYNKLNNLAFPKFALEKMTNMYASDSRENMFKFTGLNDSKQGIKSIMNGYFRCLSFIEIILFDLFFINDSEQKQIKDVYFDFIKNTDSLEDDVKLQSLELLNIIQYLENLGFRIGENY